jgi:hypothetical protein
MAKRTVKRSGKDSDGDITRLCGDWGSTSKSQAISDIDGGTHSYIVKVTGVVEAQVYVKHGASGKYLTTSPDGRTRNNLDDLPNC